MGSPARGALPLRRVRRGQPLPRPRPNRAVNSWPRLSRSSGVVDRIHHDGHESGWRRNPALRCVLPSSEQWCDLMLNADNSKKPCEELRPAGLQRGPHPPRRDDARRELALRVRSAERA